ncbi:hypothetical protein Tco_0762381 [Tanacetum coccineum]
MSARDKTGLGYGTQMDEISNKSETDSEISMSVFDVRSSDEETTPTNDRSIKADGYHVVPPPITGNFLNLRADISFAGLDEFAIMKKIIESQTTKLNTDTSKSKTSETIGNTKEVNAKKPKSINESVVSKPNVNKEKVIIEDWNSDDEDDVSEVSPVKTKETQTVKTHVDKTGQTSKKAGIRFKKPKSCFVCKSTDHLIKDCDFYDKRSPEPKLKIVVNTCQKVVKPVWDSAKRVNHQNFSNKLKYPHIRKTFVPQGVLTRTSLVKPVRLVSIARPVRTARPVSTVRPFAPKIAQTGSDIRPIYLRMDNGNPEIFLQDQAVVDSGCSSHMIGNKAYLLDYKYYNGGFVAFGSDSKGDELKFNLFSVSQMCDKKNSVLFTETECLILSPSFKLLDESQVVLRAPRKDDVYELDLKNIVSFLEINHLKKKAKHVLTHHKAWLRAARMKKQQKEKDMEKSKKRRRVSKQGRKVIKSSKGAPTVHKDSAFDDLDDILDDAMDYQGTKDAQNKESTDFQQGTDKPNEGTNKLNEGTDKLDEGIVKPRDEGTAAPTTAFKDDETIARFLVAMSQNKAKQKGVEIKDAEDSDRPRPASTRSLLTLNPLPKIDPKDKGKKKIEEDESDTESEDINEAENKFKMCAHDEEIARKLQEEWEAEVEKKRLDEE